jgi:hypothetical protein
MTVSACNERREAPVPAVLSSIPPSGRAALSVALISFWRCITKNATAAKWLMVAGCGVATA